MKTRMPATRRSVTHKAVIHSAKDRIKFFITIGLYDDGKPGEIFLTCDQSGSTLDGFSDSWAIAASMLLQTGTTLNQLVAACRFYAVWQDNSRQKRRNEPEPHTGTPQADRRETPPET